MYKTFIVEGHKYVFEYHPRTFVRFEWPDVGAPRELSDVYGSYSYAKEYAYNDCLECFKRLDGFAWQILSHNVFQFTVGFYFIDPASGDTFWARLTSNAWHLYPVAGGDSIEGN